jgi:hypothetical protein
MLDAFVELCISTELNRSFAFAIAFCIEIYTTDCVWTIADCVLSDICLSSMIEGDRVGDRVGDRSITRSMISCAFGRIII